jgi:tetratricopeptide (TPR) repeat protein
VAREKGDFASARSYYEQSLASFSRLKDGWGMASALSDLGNLCRDQFDYDEANRLYRESVKTFQNVGHQRGIARVLECLAACAAAQSKPEISLGSAGAAAALRKRLGAPLSPAEHARLEFALRPARQALGAAGLTAWMEGWAMPAETAIEKYLAMPQALESHS